MSFFRKLWGGGTEKSKPEYKELVGRLYDRWRPGESTYHCLLNHSECTLTINNKGVMILSIVRLAQEGEDIDPDDITTFRFELGVKMDFSEEVGTPCDSFGFSFTAVSTETNKPDRFLFELLEKDNLKQTEKFESILQNISTLDATLPTSAPENHQSPPKSTAATVKKEAEGESDEELSLTESEEEENENENEGNENQVNEEEQEEELSLTESEESEEEEILIELEPEESNEDEAFSLIPIERLTKKQFEKINKEEKKEICSFDCELESYENKVFKPQGKIKIGFFETGKFNYEIHFLTASGNQSFFSYKIGNEKNLIYLGFEEKSNTIEWTGKIGTFIWGLKTQLTNSFSEFVNKFIELNWNARNSSDINKLKPEDRAYILNAAIKRDYQNIFSNDDNDELIFDSSEEEEEDEEGSESDDDNRPVVSSKSSNKSKYQERNTHLALGHRFRDRAFVSRGKKVGVFSITEDNNLDYKTTISSLNDKSKIKQMMLHQQDEKMLFLDENDRNSIFSMDIERETIVNEWKTKEGFGISSIVPFSRFAQAENEQNFIGIQSGGVFVVDPRLNSKKGTVEKETSGFQYSRATNPSFSTATTTVDGDLIVGSKLGDIRVFKNDLVSRESNRKAYATNQFYLSGDPVLSVDVTTDKEWILVTCKTHLMVLPATSPSGVNAFSKKIYGAERKMPIRLELRKEHIWELGGQISFTSAKFNRDPNGNEESIVTSTGVYVISWNFGKVKQGIRNAYQIKRYGDVIVDGQFKFGGDTAIVVTLPNDVTMAKRVPKKSVG